MTRTNFAERALDVAGSGIQSLSLTGPQTSKFVKQLIHISLIMFLFGQWDRSKMSRKTICLTALVI